MAAVIRWAWLVLLLADCGSPLVDQNVRGVPVWSYSGTIVNDDHTNGLDSATNLRLALFWSPGGVGVKDPAQYVEQTSTTIPTMANAAYTLNMFDWPEARDMAHDAQGNPLGYAVGTLMLYQDTNGDGVHSNGEPFYGFNLQPAFIYAPKALPAELTPTMGPLPAGVSAVMVPEPCGDPVPQPTTSDSCGVLLGEPCATDRDCCDSTYPGCTNAYCLHQTSILWPGGYCTILEPSPDGCLPGAGVYYHITADACLITPGTLPPTPHSTTGYWLRACRQDSDCAPRTFSTGLKEFGPTQWICDPGLRACRPSKTDLLQVSVPMPGMFQHSLEPFCSRDQSCPTAPP